MSDSAGAMGILLLLLAGVVWLSQVTKSVKWITQGSLALLMGLLGGGLSWVIYELVLHQHIPQALVAFKYEIYMDLLLPIIIYQMGFSTKKHCMFSNLGALVTLGVFGTITSALMISMVSYYLLLALGLDGAGHVANSLALGVILSSSDSVAALQAIDKNSQSQLYSLTFGEGVFNDATAIVLLRSVQQIHSLAQMNAGTVTSIMLNFIQLLILSMLLGFFLGLLSAFILKLSFSKSHSTDREVSILFLVGLSSYLLAERFGLSGVFSVFFCGITQSHYAWYNLSPSAKVVAIYGSRVMGFLAETMLFLFCGLDLWGLESWEIDVTKQRVLRTIAILTVCVSVLLILVRFVVTIPLVGLINVWRKKKIVSVDAYMLALAGCARGAVTLALSMNHFLGGKESIHTHERILSASCILVAVLSTIGLGSVIPLVFDRWQPEAAESMAMARTLSRIDMHGSVRWESVVHGDRFSIKKLWTYVDRTFIQPVFGGRSMMGDHAPSPGRWKGVQSTMRVIQGHVKPPVSSSSGQDLHSPFLHVAAEEQQQQQQGEDQGDELSAVSDAVQGEEDILAPLFSMIGERQASQEAESRIDSLLEGGDQQQ